MQTPNAEQVDPLGPTELISQGFMASTKRIDICQIVYKLIALLIMPTEARSEPLWVSLRIQWKMRARCVAVRIGGIRGGMKCKIFQQSTPYVIWQTTNFGNKSNNRRRRRLEAGSVQFCSVRFCSVQFGLVLWGFCGRLWRGRGTRGTRQQWNAKMPPLYRLNTLSAHTNSLP